ncbi:hypothetical protein [Mannheimia indoligenes]|uniref:hypothetical protein n=1 Tax=Mannheimia indoligenes TaxID=3103145 RepID=UPI002FE60399
MRRIKREYLNFIQDRLYICALYNDDNPAFILTYMDWVLKQSKEEAYKNTIDIYYLLMRLNLITYNSQKENSLDEIEDDVRGLISGYRDNYVHSQGVWWYYFYTTKFCKKFIEKLDLSDDIPCGIVYAKFDDAFHSLVNQLEGSITIFDSIFEEFSATTHTAMNENHDAARL